MDAAAAPPEATICASADGQIGICGIHLLAIGGATVPGADKVLKAYALSTETCLCRHRIVQRYISHCRHRIMQRDLSHCDST